MKKIMKITFSIFLVLLFVITSNTTYSQTYELWGLGRQNGGELGNGYNTFENKFAIEYDGKKWLDIKPNKYSIVGIDIDGVLWVIGDVFLNENNLPDTNKFESEIKWKSVVVSRKNILAQKEDGSLWLMGENNSNLQDINQFIDSPSKVVTTKLDWSNIYSSFFELFAIDSLGFVYEIKSINTDNSFTNGNTININKIEDLENIKQILSLDNNFNKSVICIKNDGTILAKGSIFIDLDIPKYIYYENFVNINTGFKVDKILSIDGYLNFIDLEGNNNLLNVNYNAFSKVKYEKITSNLDLKYYFKSNNKEYVLDKTNKLYFKGFNKPTILDTFELFINDYVQVAENVKNIFLKASNDYIITFDGIVYSLKDNAMNNKNSEFIGLTKIGDDISPHGSFNNSKYQYYDYDMDYNLTSNYFIDAQNNLLGTGYNNLKLFGNKRNINNLTKVSEDKWTYFTNCINFGVGIKLDGTIWGMGNNNYNQLNDTTLYDIDFYNITNIKKYLQLKQIDNENNWSKVICNETSVFALNSNGEVYTWGLSTSLITSDSSNFDKIKLNFNESIKDIELSNFDFFAKSDSNLYYISINNFSNFPNLKPFKIIIDNTIVDFKVNNDELFILDNQHKVIKVYIYDLLSLDISYIDNDNNTIMLSLFTTIGENIKKMAFTNRFGVMINMNNQLLGYGINYNNMFNLIGNEYLNEGRLFNFDTDWDNCYASGDNILLTKSNKLGIVDIFTTSTIFPNPTSDKVSVDLGVVAVADLSIFDILGNEIMSIPNYTNKSEIDVSIIPIGTYTIQIQTPTGSVRQRLLVNR